MLIVDEIHVLGVIFDKYVMLIVIVLPDIVGIMKHDDDLENLVMELPLVLM
jgi:hypothetical protein